jgi:magnesium-transporting ATPase (P-type)
MAQYQDPLDAEYYVVDEDEGYPSDYQMIELPEPPSSELFAKRLFIGFFIYVFLVALVCLFLFMA